MTTRREPIAATTWAWAYILNVWAGRRTAKMALLDVVVAIIGLVQRFRGGVDGDIARARGELPRA